MVSSPPFQYIKYLSFRMNFHQKKMKDMEVTNRSDNDSSLFLQMACITRRLFMMILNNNHIYNN
ncbi:MAG: hypothetical protein EA375_03075 [Acholeplasmataceae bacterium]|nr:MAG: hypothetical protein EA375_03075 [Acholeplasmataceae bacterium]